MIKQILNKQSSFFKSDNYFTYLLKFIIVFCICYFGTLLIIGLAAPGGLYSAFVANYLDYVSALKNSMIKASGFILSWFHIKTVIAPGYILRIFHGRGVVIARDCVGYGVYSFWIAFVIANTGSFYKKIKWIIGGLLLLWFINVIRITLLLVAINKGWPMPLGIDHHTWFNIFAYTMICILIVYYHKSFGKNILISGKKD